MNRPSSEVGIRAATADDAVVIHRLIHELAEVVGSAEKFRSTARQFLKHGFSANPLFEALVAENDDNVVGVVLYFYTFSSWFGEPGVYVQDLVVTRAARGEGLGEQLLHELVRVARRRDVTHLRLAVDCTNTAAMRFYERCGFANIESDFIYGIEGDAFLKLGGIS